MHIVADRESISKYGLQNLLDPHVDASLKLGDFMDLLGYTSPADRAQLVAGDPWYQLLVELSRLRAKVQLLARTHPVEPENKAEVDEVLEGISDARCAVMVLSAVFVGRRADAGHSFDPQAAGAVGGKAALLEIDHGSDQ